jgi:hypothetical protein
MSPTPTTSPQQSQDASARNVTYFQGSVTGPIHTGQGDINIESLSYQSGGASREEFLQLLATVRLEFDAARQSGANSDILDDAETEIQAAEKEAKKDAPQKDRILGRLEKARDYLLSGSAVAAGLITLVSKVGELIHAAQGF